MRCLIKEANLPRGFVVDELIKNQGRVVGIKPAWSQIN
jgi:hypothetical protein